MGKIQLIPSIDQYPRVVRFVQRPIGRLFVASALLIAMYFYGKPGWYFIPLVVLVVSFYPDPRWSIITLATLSWIIIGYKHPYWWESIASNQAADFDWRIVRWIFVATIFVGSGAVAAARHYRIRRPFRAFLVAYLSLLALWSTLRQLGYHDPWAWAVLVCVSHTFLVPGILATGGQSRKVFASSTTLLYSSVLESDQPAVS